MQMSDLVFVANGVTTLYDKTRVFVARCTASGDMGCTAGEGAQEQAARLGGGGHDAGVDGLQALHAPLVQELQHGRAGAAHADVRHQR